MTRTGHKLWGASAYMPPSHNRALPRCREDSAAFDSDCVRR